MESSDVYGSLLERFGGEVNVRQPMGNGERFSNGDQYDCHGYGIDNYDQT